MRRLALLACLTLTLGAGAGCSSGSNASTGTHDSGVSDGTAGQSDGYSADAPVGTGGTAGSGGIGIGGSGGIGIGGSGGGGNAGGALDAGDASSDAAPCPDGGQLQKFYQDNDGDGYGNSAVSTMACSPPAGYVAKGGDCDDTNPNIHPVPPVQVGTDGGIEADSGADAGPTIIEQCDGKDDDCDGHVDAYTDSTGVVHPLTQACYDGAAGTEGVGVCHGGVQTCNNGSWSVCQNEQLPSPELCDGLDNDCNGMVDDSPTDVGGACTTGYLGVCSAGTYVCQSGQRKCSANIAPGSQSESCDGKDDNCDGQVDNCPVCSNCYAASCSGSGPCSTNSRPTACNAGYCSSSGSSCDTSYWADATTPTSRCGAPVDLGSANGDASCGSGLLCDCSYHCNNDVCVLSDFSSTGFKNGGSSSITRQGNGAAWFSFHVTDGYICTTDGHNWFGLDFSNPAGSDLSYTVTVWKTTPSQANGCCSSGCALADPGGGAYTKSQATYGPGSGGNILVHGPSTDYVAYIEIQPTNTSAHELLCSSNQWTLEILERDPAHCYGPGC